MRKRPFLAAVAIFCLLRNDSAQARLISAAPPHLTSSVTGRLKAGGLLRTYRLYVPKAFNKSKPVPLIIALHGGGGSGENMEAFTVGRFNELAEQEGFLVVYPDAVKYRLAKRNWNDGRGILRYPAQRDNVDDVGFIRALIDKLIAEYNVDPHRVYATGPSNGGIMTLRLGCELSDKLAAIAPVIGSIAEPLAATCRPTHALPMLMINGTDDPLISWEGGYVHFLKQQLGKVVSVADTVNFWVKRDGCALPPEVSRLPDLDPDDGTRIRREIYPSCQEGLAVILYAVEGGGHTWPGAYQYASPSLVGLTSQDINACDVIWGFFKRHARPRFNTSP